MKKIISLLMAILMIATLSLTLTSCSYKDDIRSVKEAGKLVVGVTVYKPMDYIDDATGEWTGFDAELAKMFAEELGVSRSSIRDWESGKKELSRKSWEKLMKFVQ